MKPILGIGNDICEEVFSTDPERARIWCRCLVEVVGTFRLALCNGDPRGRLIEMILQAPVDVTQDNMAAGVDQMLDDLYPGEGEELSFEYDLFVAGCIGSGVSAWCSLKVSDAILALDSYCDLFFHWTWRRLSLGSIWTDQVEAQIHGDAVFRKAWMAVKTITDHVLANSNTRSLRELSKTEVAKWLSLARR